MAWLVLDAVRMRLGVAAEYGQEPVWTAVSRDTGTWQQAAVHALSQLAGREMKDVSHITVVQGRASFSDTRFVVLLGNLTTWLNSKVKLYDVTVQEQSEAPASLADVLAASKEVRRFTPAYYAEPNITSPKQE